jgi:hypothetical protein
VDGYHAGRLAVEQIYGYMVRNAKKFGILTTVNAWVFLMRENYGKLYITRPFDCCVSEPSFTILQALYYISALAAQHGHLVETDRQGNPVAIALANTKYPRPAPSATSGLQSGSAQQSPVSATFVYPLPPSYQYRLVSCDFGHRILLEPWIPANHCGQKSFRGVLMPQTISVIVKLWDGYKSSNKERDREVQIYMHLENLWGKEIPQLICSADIDFCQGIILEDVKVL